MKIPETEVMPVPYPNDFLTILMAVLAMTAIPFAAGADGQAIALPLLESPINATWAANHAEDWHQKGFRGFLFEGILDDLRLFPSERETIDRLRARRRDAAEVEDNTAAVNASMTLEDEVPVVNDEVVPGDWDELILEIGGAANRLQSAGVDRNFLHIRLAPEEAWFTDPALLEIAERRFRLAGQFCLAANLRGIAVDTQSGSLIYDFLWDGYPPDMPPEALSEGARAFGRRVLRAFIREFPQGDILLCAGSLESARPLWFDFMEGARTAPGAARGIRMSLVLQDARDLRDRNYFKTCPGRVARWLDRRASTAPKKDGGSFGEVVFSLEPVQYAGDVPEATYPLEGYRTALYAAAVYGGEYVMIRAPKGGWWQIPPDMTEQFRHLKQGGAARVRFAPPVPITLDPFAPRLKCADAIHLGSLAVNGRDSAVMKNEKGAALLIWDGTAAELQVPVRVNMVTATHLLTGESTYFTPREGMVAIPVLPGPVLVEGLPLDDYGLPASLSMDVRSAITAGVTRAEIECGIRNPLAAPLRGSLALAGDARYALGGTAFPVELQPGETSTYRRTLRGISRFGTRPEFLLNLAIAANPAITRTFRFSVSPEERFFMYSDGPIAGAAVSCRTGGEAGPLLLWWCDVRGKLTCFDPGAGKPLWYKRLAGRFSAPPVLVEGVGGGTGAAVVNDEGRLRLFDVAGEERLTLWSEERRITCIGFLPADGTRSGGLLLAGDDGNRVAFYTVRGELTGRVALTGPISWLIAEPALPDKFFAVLSAPPARDAKGGKEGAPAEAAAQPGEVVAVDPGGKKLWETALPGGPACRPCILEDKPGERSLLIAATADGGVTCLDAADGSVVEAVEAGKEGAVLHLAASVNLERGQAWVFHTAGNTLRGHPVAGKASGRDLPKAWNLSVPGPTALAALPFGEGVVAGTTSGSLYALDVSGALLWEDHSGAGAVTGITVVQHDSNPKLYHCIVSGEDHSVRAVAIRRDLIPGAPARLDPLLPPQ